MQESLLCFACGKESLTLDKESGEIVCPLCGAVMADWTEELAQDRWIFLGDLAYRRKKGTTYVAHKVRGDPLRSGILIATAFFSSIINGRRQSR